MSQIQQEIETDDEQSKINDKLQISEMNFLFDSECVVFEQKTQVRSLVIQKLSPRLKIQGSTYLSHQLRYLRSDQNIFQSSKCYTYCIMISILFVPAHTAKVFNSCFICKFGAMVLQVLWCKSVLFVEYIIIIIFCKTEKLKQIRLLCFLKVKSKIS